MEPGGDERAYCARRETQERRQAIASADPSTAGVHRRLADLYAARIRALDSDTADTAPSVEQ